MATEMENARVTELHVRMDCNGCVQRIKKAMHGIDGVYNVYADVPEQKITVVGRADPEMLVKAIKKTKKTATICSHTEPAASEPPAAEPADPPPAEAPPAEATPAEEATPSPQEPEQPKDVEEVHMVHHYPHNYVYREHSNYPPMEEHEIRHQAPYYATHSYTSHRPSTHVSECVSEYGFNRSPPRDNYQNHGGDGNQFSSMFSDENPNACRIT